MRKILILALAISLLVVGCSTEDSPDEDVTKREDLPRKEISQSERDEMKKREAEIERQNEEREKQDAEDDEEPIEEVEVVEEDVEEVETLSQSNAVGKAMDYLNYTSFSKSGLVEQLEYEDFSNEDATYAVNKLDVDWKEQAVEKAKDYLDYSSFSRSGLIDQLKFEGFSDEEAIHAVDEVGF